MKAKIYTKTGDLGKTSLVGGTRVEKTDARLHAYGTVDELNSCLGLAISLLHPNSIETKLLLQEIQNVLFNLGSHLACEDEAMRVKLPRVETNQLSRLENKMDDWESNLPPLQNFILPGGSQASACLHVARTVCRRCERLTLAVPGVEPIVIQYLNRLSDFLFTLARQINFQLNVEEVLWTK